LIGRAIAALHPANQVQINYSRYLRHRTLALARRAVSLGDAETLVQHPASMTHATYSQKERERYGISESLVRISVGLETPADIQNDIHQALHAASKP
jgi:methionine-gamma-lyase